MLLKVIPGPSTSAFLTAQCCLRDIKIRSVIINLTSLSLPRVACSSFVVGTLNCAFSIVCSKTDPPERIVQCAGGVLRNGERGKENLEEKRMYLTCGKMKSSCKEMILIFLEL